MDREQEKRIAAQAAAELVENGMDIGLGTGSTVRCLIEILGDRCRAGLRIRAVPTSRRTQRLASDLGIPVSDLFECPRLKLTIDGADEIDLQLQLIKGGGGALLREKIVASASERFIVIADAGKRVPVLGAFPLPVEVIPFALPVVANRLLDLGAEVTIRQDGEVPFTTVEGNRLLDCRFVRIEDPRSLALRLSQIPGIVEHGLFVDMTDTAFIGSGDDVTRLAAG